MKRTIFSLCFLVTPLFAFSQFSAFLIGGYGMGFSHYQSTELGVFFDSYNAYQKSTGANLTQEFKNDIPTSRGTYWQIGGAIGGPACQAVLTVEVIKTQTKAMSARFDNTYGRDVWCNYRTSNSTVGIRFGNPAKFPVWGQFDMDMGVQMVTINSEYVYSDGSKSIGLDHDLNGRFSNFGFAIGLGAELGVKIYGPVHFVASAHWLPNLNKQHPEYHEFEDLSDWNALRSDYIPRDMNEYVNNPTNSTGNSISNDFRGLRFTAGLQLTLGNYGKE